MSRMMSGDDDNNNGGEAPAAAESPTETVNTTTAAAAQPNAPAPAEEAPAAPAPATAESPAPAPATGSGSGSGSSSLLESSGLLGTAGTGGASTGKKSSTSLLESSGLLGTATGSGEDNGGAGGASDAAATGDAEPASSSGGVGGDLFGNGGSSSGLFDEVDAEEAAKEGEERRRIQAAKEAEEAKAAAEAKKAEAERKAKAEAEAAAAAAAAAAQQQAQQQQAQMMRSGMDQINLNNNNGPPSPAAAPAVAHVDGFYRQDPRPLPGQQQPYRQQAQPPQPQPPQQSSFLARSQMLQQQQQQQQQPMPPQPPQQPGVVNGGFGASYMYSTAGQQQPQTQPPNNMYSNLAGPGGGGMPQPQQPQQQPQPHQPMMQQQQQMQQHQMQQPSPYMPLGHQAHQYPQTVQQPSVLAGLHCGSDPAVGGIPNAAGVGVGQQQQQQQQQQLQPAVPKTPFRPLYGPITCTEPLLVQDAGFFAGPPHWTYAIGVRSVGVAKTDPPSTSIRRRFRHFVALEERIRETCLGAILPPRPEKHAARAIEEASTRQTPQFALQRALELENYLNALAQHPVAGLSPALKLFLTLQDDIGTAWPEVSSSALTRLGAVGTSTAVKVAEGTSSLIEDIQKDQLSAGEDNAELLALAANEGVRMGACVQAVPKIEGAIALIREQGERAGVTGMEVSKLAKDIQGTDPELSAPMDCLASGLLRNGRRTKRLAIELGAANAPFVSQYKLCRYERMAFADRRAALKRRTAMRSKANTHAQKLMVQQHQAAVMGRPDQLGRMEMQTVMADEYAVSAVREADEVGATLQSEVARIAETRLVEWSASIKILVSSMKEACAERAAIWEGARDQFDSLGA